MTYARVRLIKSHILTFSSRAETWLNLLEVDQHAPSGFLAPEECSLPLTTKYVPSCWNKTKPTPQKCIFVSANARTVSVTWPTILNSIKNVSSCAKYVSTNIFYCTSCQMFACYWYWPQSLCPANPHTVCACQLFPKTWKASGKVFHLQSLFTRITAFLNVQQLLSF